MKKLLATSAAVALALTGVAGVTSAQAAASKTLTYGVIGGIKSYEVASSEFGNRAPFFQAVYDGLLLAKPNGDLLPGLATTWKYDSLQTGLTLTLRPNIKFTNGEKFNSAAVCANLNAFKKGDSPDATNAANMESCKAAGPLKVVITLADVDPAFINYMARNMGMMQAPKTLGTAAAKTKPVGTGMYILDTKKTQIDSVYYYTANPKYWNKSAVKFSNLVIKVISDNTAMANALRTGAVDCANLADKNAVPSLESAGLKMATQQLDWSGLTLVDKDGSMGSPLKNVKVRQALNYAIDRAAMLKVLGNGYGVVTDQVFASYSKGYDKALESYYSYDPAKAKALLKEAGYPNGFEISMPSITQFDKGISAQAIQAQLGAVGITVKYTDHTFADFFPALLAPKYPAYWMQLERSANDWQFLNFLVARTAVWNPSKYGDATTDGLLAKIQTSTGAAQGKYLKQLNKYIVEQAWFVPFFAADMKFAYSPKKVKINLQAGNAVPYLPFGVVPA